MAHLCVRESLAVNSDSVHFAPAVIVCVVLVRLIQSTQMYTLTVRRRNISLWNVYIWQEEKEEVKKNL